MSCALPILHGSKPLAAKLGDTEQPRIAFKGVMDGLPGSSKVRDRNDDLIADVLGAAESAKAAAAETKLAELAPTRPPHRGNPNEPYKAFEQMVLRNMFER
jgi:hypothetical protein